MHRDLSVLANSEKCSLCDPFDPRERRKDDLDATPAEVLAAWLLAEDDRRREIEMASRPKEAGRYTQYVYTGIPTMSSESVIVREYLGNLCFGYIPETAKLPVNKTYGVLWEKL